MREIAIFCEDNAHKVIVGALIQRIAQDYQVEVTMEWRNTTRGYGKVVQEFKDYLLDLQHHRASMPALIGVATDTNCKGRQERKHAVGPSISGIPLIYALPEPHVERWLLLDGAAFKEVCGTGCDAPDLKCDRDRYKKLLVESVSAAGIQPLIGGIELAEDIIAHIDIRRAQRADESFKQFTEDLHTCFHNWHN